MFIYMGNLRFSHIHLSPIAADAKHSKLVKRKGALSTRGLCNLRCWLVSEKITNVLEDARCTVYEDEER